MIDLTTSSIVILIARFLGGVSGGAFMVHSPIYISEVAEESIRGTLASGKDFLSKFPLNSCIPTRGMKYFLFTRSGPKTERSVVIHHSKCNVLKMGRCVGNYLKVNSLCLPAICGVQHEVKYHLKAYKIIYYKILAKISSSKCYNFCDNRELFEKNHVVTIG